MILILDFVQAYGIGLLFFHTADIMSGAQGVAEKQGYLGNLEKKSLTELKDLLSRQEKLLDNK